MKKIATFIITSILLLGCGNSTYDIAIEEANIALASGEIDKAFDLFELALEENSKKSALFS